MKRTSIEGIKVDVKAINLNHFYDSVVKELGIKRLSSLEMGVIERPHPKPNLKGEIVTTTEVAAGQEYGNTITQARPFLHPSADKFVNGDFRKDVKQDYTYLGAFLKRLARKLYSTVIECFATNGFGEWAMLSKRYMQKTGRTPNPMLVDTGTLISSIYVKYEGYTVSGKTTGGTFVGSKGVEIRQELFEEEDTKKDVPKNIKVSRKKDMNFENKKNQLKVITSKTKEKVKEKEISYEEAVERALAKINKKYKKFSSDWNDIIYDLDQMKTAQEIRKRFKI